MIQGPAKPRYGKGGGQVCGSRRAGRAAGAAQARGRRRQAGAAGWAAWACCWVVGCALGALGALSLFLSRFDSVLFLSQFLDIVHEPGS